jgi:hypothetical protein
MNAFARHVRCASAARPECMRRGSLGIRQIRDPRRECRTGDAALPEDMDERRR